jgi:hypothetical protein
MYIERFRDTPTIAVGSMSFNVNPNPIAITAPTASTIFHENAVTSVG